MSERKFHGCIHVNKYPKTHPLYKVWKSIKCRCGYTRGADVKDLKNYRDRGVQMWVSWVCNPDSFIDWALENGWREGLQIDRKDNSLGYTPDNVRFVSAKENIRNRRCTLKLASGEPLGDFCDRNNIPTQCYDSKNRKVTTTVYQRLSKRLKANAAITEKELLSIALT